MDMINLQLFFFAALLVVIAPGPGMLFVISRSLAGGRKAGIISALGTSTGIAVHIFLAGLGLSLVIFATDMGFKIMKWVGGIYLIYLAWKAFTHRHGLTLESRDEDISHASIFWQGLLVNALNPKVALFFIAFIPQFVNPASGSVSVQMMVFGTIFMVLTVVIFTAYAILSSIVRRWVIERPRVNKLIDWATGSLFVFLGIRLALSSQR